MTHRLVNTSNGKNGNDTNPIFLSNVHDIRLLGPSGGNLEVQTDDVEQGFQIIMPFVTHAANLSNASETSSVRNTVTCKYYLKNQSVWSGRGVYLRGIDLNTKNNSMIVQAICVSTHLTLFSVIDDSKATSHLEKQVCEY